MSKFTIILNVLPYVLFATFGFGAVLIEYYIGTDYSYITSKLLLSYYIFPVIILFMNWFFFKKCDSLKRTVISISSAVVFIILGFLMMFLFVKLRIELGLEI